MTADLKQTPKNKLKRLPERGSYDREKAYAILDEGLICHAGFAMGEDIFVIPMAYARMGDVLVMHGSVASRLAKTLSTGINMSVCVTHLDGLVLARSQFESSMNYRSVVAFGNAVAIIDEDEKNQALKALTEHLVPGRWSDSRQPNRKELGATTVLTMPLQEASIKVRTGPPKDLEKDMDFPSWAGVVPLKVVTGTPIPDPTQDSSVTPPEYVTNYQRPTR